MGFEALPKAKVQRAAAPAQTPAPDREPTAARSPPTSLYVQAKAADGKRPKLGAEAGILDIASSGVRGAEEPLPHVERIQQSFGRHDVTGVKAAVGGAAADASSQLGARAFTIGDKVGFKAEPDVRLAAHEAAHAVQQRAGVQLEGGVGKAGDRHEQQADAAAAAVVDGRSAEALLDDSGEPGRGGVQMACSCGGTCSSCASGSGVQFELEPAAMRLIEPPVLMDVMATTPAAEARAAGPVDEAAAPSSGGEGAAAPELPKVPAQVLAARCPAAPDLPEKKSDKKKGEGGEKKKCEETLEAYEQPPEQEKKQQQPPEPEPAKIEIEAESDSPTPGDVQDGGAPPGGDGGGCGGTGGDLAKNLKAPAKSEPAKSEVAAKPKEPAPQEPAPQEEPEPEVAEEPDEHEAESGTGLERQVGDAEVASGASWGEYLRTMDQVGDARARTARIGSEPVRFQAGADEEAIRNAAPASERATQFTSESSALLGQQLERVHSEVPAILDRAAKLARSDIDAALGITKGEIEQRINQARAHARREARIARAHVLVQHRLASAKIIAESARARSSLERGRKIAHVAVGSFEVLGQTLLDQTYARAQAEARGVGDTWGGKAIEKGRNLWKVFKKGRINQSDGFWDGHLTDRRADARAKTAMTVSQSFRDNLMVQAEKQARALIKGRPKDCEQLIQIAMATGGGINEAAVAMQQALGDGTRSALAAARTTRDNQIRGIDKALSKTTRSLDRQEHREKQKASDTAFIQQRTVERTARSAATALARGAIEATDAIGGMIGEIHAAFSTEEPPPAAVLDEILTGTRTKLRVGITELAARIDAGTGDGVEAIGTVLRGARDALHDVRAGNAEQAREAEHATSQAMGGFRKTATTTFTELGSSFTKQARELAASGLGAFVQAVMSLIGAYGKILSALTKSFGESKDSLASSFQCVVEGQKEGDLEPSILTNACEAAKKEKPAWKKAFAILLIILVIVIAILAGPLVIAAVGGIIGAGLAATVIGGAIVGALSSAVIQVISNVADGETWHKGVGKAALIGAVTGGIGAGIGKGIGAIGKLSTFGRQLAANVIADLAVEGIQQAITGEFNWKSFALTLGMSIAGGGLSKWKRFAKFSDAMTKRGEKLGAGVRAKVTGKPAAPHLSPPGAVVAKPRADATTPAPAKPTADAPAAKPVTAEAPAPKSPTAETPAPSKPTAETPAPGKPTSDRPAAEPKEPIASKGPIEPAPLKESQQDGSSLVRTGHAEHQRPPTAKGGPEARVRTDEKLTDDARKVHDELRHSICGQCFPAGTKVLTPDGYRDIESIAIGDRVLSRHDDVRGDVVVRPVLNVFRNSTDQMVEFVVRGIPIQSTPGHVLWTVENGWSFAGDVEVGQHVFLSNGTSASVEETRRVDVECDTYNIETDECHTYFVTTAVGTPGIWVHNTSAVRILEPLQVHQLPLPQIVITDPAAIRMVLGKEILARGRHATVLGGLFQYLKKGGGAGFIGVTAEPMNQLGTVAANVKKKDGGVIVLVNLDLVDPKSVWNLADPATRAKMEAAYPGFEKMYDRMVKEGVVAIRKQIPTRAVQGLVGISQGLSDAEIKVIAESLARACGVK